MIYIYINGIKIAVKKNITVLQACQSLNINISKFCFQKNLQIAGNCRMCLVEITNSPKPVASCAMPVLENMKIFTNTPLVQKAKESVLEFLLLNHPLDCPICDQASECDLQDQTLIYGSDKSRFFFKKRVVEDKYCGPFIKTIMTRCIHCTRCVRFANEVCGIDNLGTTGRGNKTEISFYLKNIFFSELSGNLVDLCPVGALTSKPFAFKARAWELQQKTGIDVLDSTGSNVCFHIFNNKIIRILPKTNYNINKEWILNKTRFFFDSLNYQRIEYPLLKDQESGLFKKISWFRVFKLLNKKLTTVDSSQIKVIIGDLIDLESLFLLKKNLKLLGISSIELEQNYTNNNFSINGDLTSSFLFKTSFKELEKADLCLIINSDLRSENGILNVHLLNRLKQGNFIIASIGSQINTNFTILNLGLTFETLLEIFLGKHFFCKKIIKAKNPVFIFGNNLLLKKNGWFFYSKFTKLIFLKKLKVNFLASTTSLIHFLEIHFSNIKLNTLKNKLIFFFNTSNAYSFFKKTTNFKIYQGHHFTLDAEKSNLILPGMTSFEKKGTYINLEGFIQSQPKILNLNTEQRQDSLIFKYLYKYLLNINKKKQQSFFLIKDILSYLSLSKLKFTSFSFLQKKRLSLKNIFFNSFSKNYFYSTIFEQYSKILVHSKKIIKINNNFKLTK
jgi:NADH-quinone oxidoreductase chain G